MPLLAAVTLRYRHPGRKVALLRAYVADIPASVQTHSGEELSLGPVEFSTDFGSWCSNSKQHGGWNVCADGVWFAFNCKGAGHTLWKMSFSQNTEHCNSFTAKHPYENNVDVSADVESVARWRIHTWSVGERLRATRSSVVRNTPGFMPAKKGAECTVLYAGEEGDTKDWLYVESESQRGWIEKSCFEAGTWEEEIACPHWKDFIIVKSLTNSSSLPPAIGS